LEQTLLSEGRILQEEPITNYGDRHHDNLELDSVEVGSGDVRLSDVLAGLSLALDLTEGQRPGHATRTCLIGMRIAEALGLSAAARSSLFYALLMKDLGCSSNAARFAALFGADDHQLKANLKTINWSHALESFRYVATNVAPGQFWLRRVWQALAVFARGPQGAREVVQTRCERGADIAQMLGFPAPTVEAICTIDEHWDGHGQPYELKGHDIPLAGRIVGLAQTVEVFYSTHGVLTAYDMAGSRRGTWFDPMVTDAFLSIRQDSTFWRLLAQGGEIQQVAAIEPPDRVMMADDAYLDRIAEAFANVIDAKSPWTYQHSNGVARIAVSLAEFMGLTAAEVTDLRRAALLHDLGKLSISNLILDKPGKLSNDEMTIVQRHPAHTYQILDRVGCFRRLANMASSHHERLDGRGYHRRLVSRDLDLGTRVLSVADVCDALLAPRPYRPGLPLERVVEIMGREVGSGLDPECFVALTYLLDAGKTGVEDPGVPAVRVVRDLAEDYHQAA
jgi:putative nucleotidyltransferase with HDIG domain